MWGRQGCRLPDCARRGSRRADADLSSAASLVEASDAIAAGSQPAASDPSALEFLDQRVIGLSESLREADLGSPAELLERRGSDPSSCAPALRRAAVRAHRSTVAFAAALQQRRRSRDTGLDAGRDVEDAALPVGRDERLGNVVHVDVVARGLPEAEEGRGAAAPEVGG